MILDFSKKIFVLAPLAGYTDLPFRRVAKRFGADLTVSEMVSSNALVFNPPRTERLLAKDPLENPYSVQLAGNDEDIITRAVSLLNEREGIDIIDLNCGCPVPKIVCHGSGSSLLKDLDKMGSLIAAIKKTSNKPYTSAKIRIGFDTKKGVEIAKMCEAAGADFIAVHGRTRSGKFEAPVDYDEIGRIKAAVSIPVIANGDITSYQKAHDVLAHTGADGVMIGRGAIGAPWIFYQLKYGESALTPQLRKEIVLEHFNAMIDFHGEFGVRLFRKHLHTYTKGMAEAATFRDKINRMDESLHVREAIEAFF